MTKPSACLMIASTGQVPLRGQVPGEGIRGRLALLGLARTTWVPTSSGAASHDGGYLARGRSTLARSGAIVQVGRKMPYFGATRWEMTDASDGLPATAGGRDGPAPRPELEPSTRPVDGPVVGSAWSSVPFVAGRNGPHHHTITPC